MNERASFSNQEIFNMVIEVKNEDCGVHFWKGWCKIVVAPRKQLNPYKNERKKEEGEGKKEGKQRVDSVTV